MTLRVIQSLSELKAVVQGYRRDGETIGFVPTMGALHEGHFSLIQRSKKEQKRTLVSIFVNPLQFGPNEDFEKYPRTFEADRKLCEQGGADIVLSCSKNEMYPAGYQTYVNVEILTQHLCGASRPGHFRGVTTVVCKLFNLVEPDFAYFGKKDAQQCLILQKMVHDLNMNLRLVFCETLRESDGLALSSRNRYLNSSERKQAICLKKALDEAQNKIKQGEFRSTFLKEGMESVIRAYPLAKIDYISFVDQAQIQPLEILKGDCLIALAVFLGNTRLIDNLWITRE
ncbi:MAG: pantoate--beta-alanine ligase [Planctomycetota bacterium]